MLLTPSLPDSISLLQTALVGGLAGGCARREGCSGEACRLLQFALCQVGVPACPPPRIRSASGYLMHGVCLGLG